MGKKDITEKVLFDHNDVFADIFNALFFQGEQIIKPEALEEAPTFSNYQYEGEVRSQERDVTKYWKDGNIRLALYGIENQTAVDPNIALRMIGYDGAAYRSQLSNNEQSDFYPVVSAVLYFGENRWNAPKSLKDRLKIPQKLEPFVNDYRVQVFEIPYLEPEQVEYFHSDFKCVADYFVQLRKTRTYNGTEQQLKHVEDVFQLLKALTGDKSFAQAGRLAKFKGGECTMFAVLSEMLKTSEDHGIKLGEARGIKLGEARGIKLGEARGEDKMAEKVQKALQELIDSQQISKEGAALLQSVTQKTGA